MHDEFGRDQMPELRHAIVVLPDGMYPWLQVKLAVDGYFVENVSKDPWGIYGTPPQSKRKDNKISKKSIMFKILLSQVKTRFPKYPYAASEQVSPKQITVTYHWTVPQLSIMII